jgi:hypothetical protein
VCKRLLAGIRRRMSVWWSLAELLANKYESAARAERMGYGKYAASRLIYYTCIAFEISTPVRPTLLSRPAVPLEVTHLWKKIG